MWPFDDLLSKNTKSVVFAYQNFRRLSILIILFFMLLIGLIIANTVLLSFLYNNKNDDNQ